MGDDKAHIGARDDGDHRHFRLTAGQEGQQDVDEGRVGDQRHDLDEDQRQKREEQREDQPGTDGNPQFPPGDAGIFRPDGDADEELRRPDDLGRGAVVDQPGKAQPGGQDHRPEDRRAEDVQPFGDLPAKRPRDQHDRRLHHRNVGQPQPRRAVQVGAVKRGHQEGRDGHDDQHPRGVDQAHRADIAARLLAKEKHVLKPAGHRRIEGGRAVEPHHPAQERIADPADHHDIKRHQRDGGPVRGQPGHEVRRHRCPDGDTQITPHRGAKAPHVAHPHPGQRHRQTAQHRAKEKRQGPAERKEHPGARKGRGDGRKARPIGIKSHVATGLPPLTGSSWPTSMAPS